MADVLFEEMKSSVTDVLQKLLQKNGVSFFVEDIKAAPITQKTPEKSFKGNPGIFCITRFFCR